jgi:hypothetical protein
VFGAALSAADTEEFALCMGKDNLT